VRSLKPFGSESKLGNWIGLGVGLQTWCPPTGLIGGGTFETLGNRDFFSSIAAFAITPGVDCRQPGRLPGLSPRRARRHS
jgi:hypothetical protein